ncbi:MAG: leucine-rich repeat protein, partial [Armatimonadota bacterium]
MADQSIDANTSTGPLAFTVGPLEATPASLTVSATSSNISLVPNANIVFGGSGANRTVTLTPAPGLTGETAVVLTVSDGLLTASSSFSLIVNPPPPYSYTIANGAVTLTGYTGGGGAVSIPGTISGLPVTRIEDYAFASCYSLTSVAIPAGITRIGVAPFADCPGLTAITVAAANTNYRSEAGVLFDNALTVLIQYPGAKAGSYA